MSFKLNGKVAMVTGCTTDLSRGMAVGLAETGVDVVGIYNRTEPSCGQDIEWSAAQSGYLRRQCISGPP